MIFINNKYTKCYYRLINNAINREISQNLYLEKHHIIPKSLGGNNKKENLVKLTPREHFICHLLLTKMLNKDDSQKMIYALWQMTKQKNKHQLERYKVTGRVYDIIRKNFSKTHSKNMKENHPFNLRLEGFYRHL